MFSEEESAESVLLLSAGLAVPCEANARNSAASMLSDVRIVDEDSMNGGSDKRACAISL